MSFEVFQIKNDSETQRKIEDLKMKFDKDIQRKYQKRREYNLKREKELRKFGPYYF